MKALIHVSPRRCTDCAITSMATITGITYEKALKLILPNRKKYTDYSATIENILDCFVKLKINVSQVNNPVIKDLKNHSILIIKIPYKGNYDYHAVVWDAKRKVILDGWKKPRSYYRYQKKVLYCFKLV